MLFLEAIFVNRLKLRNLNKDGYLEVSSSLESSTYVTGGHPNKGYSRDITPNCHNCCNLYLFMLFVIIIVSIHIY